VQFRSNVVSGYAYAFMAPPNRVSSFSNNSFAVDCLPGTVNTYGDAPASNTFLTSGQECKDLPSALRKLAADGDPEWQIRLAASLIEGQSRIVGQRRCKEFLEALLLLKPLSDGGMIAAREQFARLAPALPPCTAGPAIAIP
jgi:hypothetical protein